MQIFPKTTNTTVTRLSWRPPKGHAKENYEKEHPEYEQYKALTTGKKTEKTEEKPVMEAINMLYNGEMLIKTVGKDGELETVELTAKDKEMIAEQEKEAGDIEAAQKLADEE